MVCSPVVRCGGLTALVGALSLWLLPGCGDGTGRVNACLPGQICNDVTGAGGAEGGGPTPGSAGTAVMDGGGPMPGSAGTAVADDGIPCRIRSVLEKRCTLCHSAVPQYGAPMALTAYSDFTQLRGTDGKRPVSAWVKDRINDASPSLRMPPVTQEPLDAEELADLNAWLDAGAPKSTVGCGPFDVDGGGDGGEQTTGGGDIDTSDLECFKLVAHAGDKSAKYMVGSVKDKYVNFSFAAPWTGTAYGIVVRPTIDNTHAIHHWLLFQVDSGVTDGDIRSSSGSHPDGDLIHGWAPGGIELNLRRPDIRADDVGFEFPAGTGFELEIHYNSSDPSARDASGAEVCVQKKTPKNLAGTSWLGSDALFGLSNTKSTTCDPRDDRGPIHIISVSPHMHLTGNHMSGIVHRKDGKTLTLHDAPFSFNDQTLYPKNEVLEPGDTIVTRCDWDAPATFGKATSDEMCYLFTLAYPKGALSDGKPVGAAAHGGGACLGL